MVKARYDMPSASEQKLTATVFRQIQEIKCGKREEVDAELTMKPDISKSKKSKAKSPVKA